MLRIGLTGGIGAGKSAVSSIFAQCGGVVIDGDLIAREVVAPGTPGLAALVDQFGTSIVLPSGELNRSALAAIAFSDDDSRAALNAIVHPLVAHRRAELLAATPANAVVVEDIPLLVENQMAPLFPLVVVVHADLDVRLARLIHHRGMTESDARARIAAQATEDQRREVADIWLDNSGTQDDLLCRATALWHKRIAVFADNLAARKPADVPVRLVPADPTWPHQARRIVARLTAACGHRARRIDHIGSTAVAGFEAKDVIDIQITVDSLACADELADAILGAGYPRIGTIVTDNVHPPLHDIHDTSYPSGVVPSGHSLKQLSWELLWQKRFHASADPGRAANIHIRVAGWPNQQFALLFVDWLNAHPQERADYLMIKRNAATQPDRDGYTEAKEPWLRGAYQRAWQWASATEWHD